MVKLKGAINHKLSGKRKKYVPATLVKKHSPQSPQNKVFQWNHKLTAKQNYQALNLTGFQSESHRQKNNFKILDFSQKKEIPEIPKIEKIRKIIKNSEEFEMIEEFYEKFGIDFEIWEKDLKINKNQKSAGELKKIFKNYLKFNLQNSENFSEEEILNLRKIEDFLNEKIDEESFFVHKNQKNNDSIEFGNIAEIKKNMK